MGRENRKRFKALEGYRQCPMVLLEKLEWKKERWEVKKLLA
jgi:hypothetical protein